ncbi:MAG: hypothetical protein J7578_00135 [Chitinophagaceae bacterium]|nr:hypothetical protein [Chitinophagaceae bacterium]
MRTTITIPDLLALWDANEVNRKKKAIVFELSNYTSTKGLDLIICLENISTCSRTLKFRSNPAYQGFSYEHDAINFLQNENGKFISFSTSVLEAGLQNTIDVLKEFSIQKGFLYCNPLGFHSKKRGEMIWHFWMGQDMGK